MPKIRQFEVVIVGAGPAGLAAAKAARSACSSIALLDENPLPGGQIYRGSGRTVHRAVSCLVEELQVAGVTFLTSSTVYDAPAPGRLWVQSPKGSYEINYEKLILATGARELFLPYPGWTLPNVMGIGGLQALVKSGWDIRGKRVVVAGAGPLVLAVSAAAKAYGADVRLVAEQSEFNQLARFGLTLVRFPNKAVQGLPMVISVGSRYRSSTWIESAQGANAVESVTVCKRTVRETIACDVLACSYGFVPNIELPSLIGCEIHNGVVKVDTSQLTTVPNVYCVGEPTGVGGVDLAGIEGSIGGYAATGQIEFAKRLGGKRQAWHRFAEELDAAFKLRPEVKSLANDETVICRCEDVRKVELSGCESARAAKLQTRCGMGACQGRICGAAGRALFGWESMAIRPPLSPVPLAGLCEVTGAENHESGRN